MKTAMILFTILLLGNTILKSYSSIATYYVNKTYYAEVLCENKENASLECEGSCQLNMKILELSQLDQATSNIIKIEFQNLLFVSAENSFDVSKAFSTQKQIKSDYYEKNYTFLSLPKKDKPPISFL